jgi:hypothetical protein
MMITSADATSTRNARTPSRQPTPGGSRAEVTDLIGINRQNVQARLDDLLAGVYERLRRESGTPRPKGHTP